MEEYTFRDSVESVILDAKEGCKHLDEIPSALGEIELMIREAVPSFWPPKKKKPAVVVAEWKTKKSKKPSDSRSTSSLAEARDSIRQRQRIQELKRGHRLNRIQPMFSGLSSKSTVSDGTKATRVPPQPENNRERRKKTTVLETEEARDDVPSSSLEESVQSQSVKLQLSDIIETIDSSVSNEFLEKDLFLIDNNPSDGISTLSAPATTSDHESKYFEEGSPTTESEEPLFREERTIKEILRDESRDFRQFEIEEVKDQVDDRSDPIMEFLSERDDLNEEGDDDIISIRDDPLNDIIDLTSLQSSYRGSRDNSTSNCDGADDGMSTDKFDDNYYEAAPVSFAGSENPIFALYSAACKLKGLDDAEIMKKYEKTMEPTIKVENPIFALYASACKMKGLDDVAIIEKYQQSLGSWTEEEIPANLIATESPDENNIFVPDDDSNNNFVPDDELSVIDLTALE